MRIFHRAGFTFLLVSSFIVSVLCQARADQVTMTNGDRVSGRLVAFSQTAVSISTPHSGVIQIDRAHIQQVVTEQQAVVELVSGERIIGFIGPGEGRTVVIHSAVLGDRALSLDLIKDIREFAPHENQAREDTADAVPQTLAIGSDKSIINEGMSRLSPESCDVRGKGAESSLAQSAPAGRSAVESGQPKSIGQRPEAGEDIRRIFLRQSSVLLQPRQKEVEIGFTYMRNQSIFSIYNAKYRSLRLPLAFRVGILDGLEGFITMPIALSQQELAFAGDSIKQTKTGVGDATAGLNLEIFRETTRWPEIVIAMNVEAPTGGTPQEEGLSLGSGHWTGTFGAQFIKTIDPVVLFWGINYRHQFPARHFLNDRVYEVSPGETVDYNFGFGFAVNENISLSTQVLGSYQGETETDGIKVAGSSNEPVSLRLALTHRFSKSFYIEPSVTIGLDDDSPDFIIGISATSRFGRQDVDQ